MTDPDWEEMRAIGAELSPSRAVDVSCRRRITSAYWLEPKPPSGSIVTCSNSL